MKRPAAALLLCAVMALTALFGCDNVEPVVRGTPTPSASPTPLPPAFSAEITAEPQSTDLLGSEIAASDHYFNYLSFGDLRVYEYDDGTFLDGICVNAYPLPLDGVLNIVYYTGEGKICGVGQIQNALGGTRLETGSNAIYAEISTDIDVRMMDFKLEIVTDFMPVLETASD